MTNRKNLQIIFDQTKFILEIIRLNKQLTSFDKKRETNYNPIIYHCFLFSELFIVIILLYLFDIKNCLNAMSTKRAKLLVNMQLNET